MIDEKFKKIIEKKNGFAVIIAGSDSDDKPKGDKPSHIEQIVESIEEFRIPYQVRICSAHKQLSSLGAVIEEYNSFKGPLAIIAVAAGTDALSGSYSFNTDHPVISCPPDAPNQSCLTNPLGSANAYIPHPQNVGKFIAQMFSSLDETYRGKLHEIKQKKINSLVEADERIQQKYLRRMEERYKDKEGW